MPRARFKFVLYRDGAGEFRWRLVSSNGNIVADCAEGYRHRSDALRIVEAIRSGATAGAPVVDAEQVSAFAAAVKQSMAAKRTSIKPTAKRAALSPATKRTA